MYLLIHFPINSFILIVADAAQSEFLLRDLIFFCFQISESSAGGSSSRRPVQAYKKSVTSSRLPNVSNYEDYEFNNNNSSSFLGEGEDRRKKEVEDLISKYAKKKDKDEVIHSPSAYFCNCSHFTFLTFQLSLFPFRFLLRETFDFSSLGQFMITELFSAQEWRRPGSGLKPVLQQPLV